MFDITFILTPSTFHGLRARENCITYWPVKCLCLESRLGQTANVRFAFMFSCKNEYVDDNSAKIISLGFHVKAKLLNFTEKTENSERPE